MLFIWIDAEPVSLHVLYLIVVYTVHKDAFTGVILSSIPD